MSGRGQHGFTLIELLVVVSILGLLALTALPSSGSGFEARLDLVELQVTDALARAASLARSTRQPHGVVFHLATDRFAIVDKNGTAVTDPLTRRPFVVDFQRPDQPQGIDFTGADFGANGTAAIFDAQGLPVTAGTVVISCHGQPRTMALDKATGKFGSS